MARKSREEMSRNNQGRETVDESRNDRDEMIRQKFRMFHRSDFDFPPEKIPPDKVYCWARLKVRGQEDQDRINSLHQDGWDPVPRSRHPEYSPPKIWGENSGLDKYIVVRGCNLLMERSKEIDNMFKNRYKQEYEDSIRRDAALDQVRQDMIKDTGGEWKPYSRDDFKYYSPDVNQKGVDPYKGATFKE